MSELTPEQIKRVDALFESKAQNLPQHEGYADMADRDQEPSQRLKWGFVKRCLNGHLIVQLDQFQRTGVIIVPDKAKHRPTTGHVVAIAADITDVEVGDKILFSQYAGYLLKFANTPLARMLSYSEVIAVLEEAAPDLETEGA